MNVDWHPPSYIDWRYIWHLIDRSAGHFEYLFTLGIGAGVVAFRRWLKRMRENRASGWPSADATRSAAA